MVLDKVKHAILNQLIDVAHQSIASPIKGIAVDGISTSVRTIGTFVTRKISDQFVQTISFNTDRYYDSWIESALFDVLDKYNDLRHSPHVKFLSPNGTRSLDVAIDIGLHHLKYRKWTIHVNVEKPQTIATINDKVIRYYTIYVFTSDKYFIDFFERDLLNSYYAYTKVSHDPMKVNMYVSRCRGSRFNYWSQVPPINARPIDSIYLDYEDKKLLVDTINKFFSNVEIYRKNGIPHNLKILLYGQPGPQPYSTIIPTPTGHRFFGDLKVGDEVYTRIENGVEVTTTIEEIYEKGELSVYEMEFEDGIKVHCGAEHMWPVVSDEEDKEFVERSTLDILHDVGMGRPVYVINPDTYKDDSVRILRVHYTGYKENMRCIHVADPSHIYLTTGCIPTMNCGKDSIARMIATEWRRNIYYIDPGFGGASIPEALSDDEVGNALFIISDIDNYPEIINHSPGTTKALKSNDDDEDDDEDDIKYRRNTVAFAKMLNVLDGMMSGQDRIIIMTTNHVEKIESSFLRAGRIDLAMEVKPIGTETFRRFIYDKYHKILPKDIKLKTPDGRVKVSELQADVIFKEMSFEEICEKYIK